MAQFKISLLTFASPKGFIGATLSDYKSESQNICYTYNEKYSQHQNAQKELTFSMDRQLLMHDEWMKNPFASAIHVGSIIELIDIIISNYGTQNDIKQNISIQRTNTLTLNNSYRLDI